MFNGTYSEIEVKSIKSELRPIITYGIKDEGNENWVTCKRFDTSKNTTTLNDLSSETKNDENGIPFVNCTLSSFGEISIGNKESSSNVLLIIITEEKPRTNYSFLGDSTTISSSWLSQ